MKIRFQWSGQDSTNRDSQKIQLHWALVFVIKCEDFHMTMRFQWSDQDSTNRDSQKIQLH